MDAFRFSKDGLVALEGTRGTKIPLGSVHDLGRSEYPWSITSQHLDVKGLVSNATVVLCALGRMAFVKKRH